MLMPSVFVPKVSMASECKITVQVCYITPQKQFLQTLQVEQGCTVEQAVLASGLLDECPGLMLSNIKTGIYSKMKSLDTVLKQHDRVEIYRPLLVDPMVARRARADKKANQLAQSPKL